MELILIDDRLDLGEFGDLMDQGLGVIACEPVTTASVSDRLAVERVANLLGRVQAALGLAMS